MADTAFKPRYVVKPVTGKGLAELLTELLGFESTLGPDQIGTYLEDYDNPRAINYWEMVISPEGWRYPVLSGDGRPILRDMSYREYFQALRVDGVWHSSPHKDAALVYRMQCAATNAWNFVGYQFGEAALIDTGYYVPRRKPWRGGGPECDAYYRFTDHAWSEGETEILTGPSTIATRANSWQGSFTGKDGIASLSDLRDPPRHEAVMRTLVRSNLSKIQAAVRSRGRLQALLDQRWMHPRTGAAVQCSLSGVIACAHLCGWWATLNLLRQGPVASDETGTSALSYMQMFGGCDITLVLFGL